mgnify:CR=1 FL=1|jgi:ectoine hydroxylase-related dioxygenase (phytanoyl-CoA dioxygenase family)
MSSDQKHVKKILKDGYTIVDDLVSLTECEKIKKITKKLYKKYKNSIVVNNPLEQTIYNLHNKNPIFLKYIDYKKTIDIIKKTLSLGSYENSDDIIIRQTAMRNPLKGHAQQLHNDVRIVGCKFPLVIHVIYMIDDFTLFNGGTRLVPKSHLKEEYAKNGKVYKNERIITGKKGSALIFNASSWHGSAKKINDDERWGMIFSYSRWFLKSDFDFNKNTPLKVYNKLTLNQKKLMGFNFNPSKDEFTRSSAKSFKPDLPTKYLLPN